MECWAAFRLLRWDQIQPNGILFKPTKTEKSSGKQVLIPLNDAVHEVLATAKAMWPIPSDYVIRNARGQPYTAKEARNMGGQHANGLVSRASP